MNCTDCASCNTTDDSVTIDLGPGDNVTCTFTNTSSDINVTKSASPTLGAPLTNITYTITVTNTGNYQLDPVQLVDTLPAAMTYVAAGTTPAPDDVTGNVITWNNVGPLAKSGDPGDSTTITLIARINAGASVTLTNNVSANATYPVNQSVSANATASVTITDGGRGGGGVGAGGGYTPPSACPLTLTANVLGNTTTASMTLDGVLCQDCVALGPQGQTGWEADAGTKLTLANNRVPRLIKITLAGSPPPPSNAAIVGHMYNVNAYASTYVSVPSPITISPPSRIVLGYDPDDLPENSTALLIARYDEEAGQWVDLETAGYVAGGVEVPNALTSQVSRFSTFAVLAKLAAEAPAKTTQAPASTAQVAPETAEQPSSAINWWLIGGIIAVVLALAIWLAVRRRQLRGY